VYGYTDTHEQTVRQLVGGHHLACPAMARNCQNRRSRSNTEAGAMMLFDTARLMCRAARRASPVRSARVKEDAPAADAPAKPSAASPPRAAEESSALLLLLMLLLLLLLLMLMLLLLKLLFSLLAGAAAAAVAVIMSLSGGSSLNSGPGK